jgi:hypothetical protein
MLIEGVRFGEVRDILACWTGTPNAGFAVEGIKPFLWQFGQFTPGRKLAAYRLGADSSVIESVSISGVTQSARARR